MKYCRALAVVLTGLPLGTVKAEQKSQNIVVVKVVFDTLTAAIAQLQSVDYTNVSEAKNSPIYKEVHPSAIGSSGRTVEMNFQAHGKKFRYHQKLTEYDGGGVRSREYAYDGKKYQYFNDNLGVLSVQETDPQNGYFALALFNSFNQFGFLLAQLGDNQNSIDLGLLSSPQAWQRSFAGAKFLRYEEMEGEQCIVLQFPGGMDRFFRVSCNYLVYFSPKHKFFPIAWKSVSEKGRVLLDYRVTEVGSVPLGSGSFFYPRKSVTTEYTAKGYAADMSQVTVESEIKSFTVNSIASDEIFTLDALKANERVDLDKNGVVPTPR
ncbi:MAG: hypothetical protein ACREKL_01840 [Chthoniobacterales bacterium]